MPRKKGSYSLPEQDIKRLASARDDNGQWLYSNKAMAEQLGCARSSISRHVKLLGLARRMRNIDWPKLHPRIVELEARRDADGYASLSYTAIADAIGLKKDTLWRYCKAHCIGYNEAGHCIRPAYRHGTSPMPSPPVLGEATAAEPVRPDYDPHHTLPPLASLSKPLPAVMRGNTRNA